MRGRGIWLGMIPLAALALCLGGCGRPRPETPTGLEMADRPAGVEGVAQTIGMSGSEFSPDYLVVAAGTAVTFVNDDSVRHSVTPDLAPGGPDSSEDFPNGMKPGDRFEWSVPLNAQDGTAWYFHCRFHGKAGDGNRPGAGMSGVIEVGPTGAAPAR